ncbi:MAG TPA: DNA polymerase/3'-5' exonuclease PolX [Tepidisphaeraceae bacterium]|jgi:DNA polymerase (family 10)
MSLNHDLEQLFKTAAAVMEIKGEAVFKAIAFTKVARLLGDSTIDIKAAVEDGSVADIEGVGKSSRKIIEDFVRTGRSPDIDELASSIPVGLIPLMNVPGLGPKTIKLLWKERGITGMGELIAAIDAGKLEGLPGMGEKKIKSIREGIDLLQSSKGRIGLVDAMPIAQRLADEVRALPGVKHADVAGSLRRWRETIGDVDIVAAVGPKADTSAVTHAFVTLPLVEKILGEGPTKASVLVEGGLQVDLRIIPELHYGAALQYFTGSKDHNKKVRGIALDKGMTLNEWGLYDHAAHEKAEKQTGQPPVLKPIASKTEADVYKALGLAYVEPELREDRGEVEQAGRGELPELITLDDLRGDLHTHTTASDGEHTIEAMAKAAKALGYAYLAITDHSRSQTIANGLTAERLLKHVAAIRKVAEKIKGITLLAGSEVDILVDGRLDYEESVLRELDFVVASPHVSLKQDTDKATDRILRAIDTPCVNVIGHPTGRLINARAGLPLDITKVIERAVAANVALEINSGWPRLDLNDVNARAALAAGAKLSINTDAHSTNGLNQRAVLGVSVARRAGATAGSVINTFTVAGLEKFIALKR